MRAFARASRPLVLVLTSLAVSMSAAADGWRSAETPGTLAFTPAFEGQEIPGEFRRFDVRLDGTPGADDPVSLAVHVDIASVAFDDDDIQAEVTGPDWFHSGRFPGAVFRSARIAESGDGGWRAEGRLTIKGVTRPLTLPFRFEAEGDEARLTGAVTLDRRSFDIGAGAWAEDDSIGFAVPVRFDARLRPDDAP